MKKSLVLLLLFCFVQSIVRADESDQLSYFNLDSILSMFKFLDESNSFVEAIQPGVLQNLPVGIKYKLGTTSYDLMLSNMQIEDSCAWVDLYLRMTTPSNTQLYFATQKAKVSKHGGYIDEVKLGLLGDVVLNKSGESLKLILKGSGKKSNQTPLTYALFDCDGFKELSINAELEFSEKLIVPVRNNQVVKGEKLRIGVECLASGWDDILLNIQVPEFEVVGFSGWRFKSEVAILDLSELRNDPQMAYHSYDKDYYPKDISDLWKGVFFSSLSVKTPSYFKNTETGESPTFYAQHIWFDERGFSGKIGSENLICIDKGSLGGWGFSIDDLSLSFVENSLHKGQMFGKLLLPSESKNHVNYATTFLPDQKIILKVDMEKKLKFSFLKADQVELRPTSYIEVSVDTNKDVHAIAFLNGKMSLSPFRPNEEDMVDAKNYFGSIGFSGMKIENKEPYFSVKEFNYDKEISVSGFPASISCIKLKTNKPGLASLCFDVNIHLTSENDGGFRGALGLTLNAKLNAESERQQWKFESLAVTDIELNASNTAFKMRGLLSVFKDDKRYGDGFKGEIDFKINHLDMNLKSKLQFGKMPTFRYWYADIMADLGRVGVPIFPGFQLSGFGGGAYQRMRLETDNETNTMGERVTLTGLHYFPDSTIGLGLKAYTVVSTQAKDVMNAELSLEMAFNKNNGLSYITFRGLAKFLEGQTPDYFTKLTQGTQALLERADPDNISKRRSFAAQNSPFTSSAFISYDFSNKALFGQFDSYLQLGTLKGKGADGYLGKVEFYFDRSKWHLFFGTPEKRLNVELNLGLIKISTGMYMMTGHDLPAMPSIPARTARLLKTEDEVHQLKQRSLHDIQHGSGFAMGANLGLNSGNLNFMMFYASFDSDLGFDILLKKYSGVSCKNRGGSLGINGWYAMGQAYAYMYTDMGIRVALFGAKRNISILQGELASLLEAQLPNPSMFAGGLAVNYSVLNGLFKGYCNFKFQLGDACDMQEDGILSAEGIIADLTPSDKQENIDVLCVPQVAFNLGVKEFDTYLDGGKETVHVKLDRYKLSVGGSEIKGDVLWNEEKDILSFTPNNILPSNKTFDVEVQISASKLQNGVWQAIKDQHGNNFKEVRSVQFKTGKAPDSIPISNIRYAYPYPSQSYYLVNESSKGYMKLKQGQPELLDAKKYTLKVLLIQQLDTLQIPFTYSSTQNLLSWKMPILKRNSSYMLQLCATEKVTNVSPQNMNNYKNIVTTKDVIVDQKNISLEQVTGSKNGEKVICQYEFKTSKYGTFSEKMNAIQLTSIERTPFLVRNLTTGNVYASPDVHYLQAKMSASEKFDKVEIFGSSFTNQKALIKAEAQLDNNMYYKNSIFPLVYKFYPYQNCVNFNRTSGRALIPSWAIYLSLLYEDSPNNNQFPWVYYLPYHYKDDLDMVKVQIANAMSKNVLGVYLYKDWLGKSFIPISKGDYSIVFQYIFPNGEVGSATSKIFKNPY